MPTIRPFTPSALAFALTLTLSGALPALAQDASGMPGMPGMSDCPQMAAHQGEQDWLQGRMAAQLQLNEAQKASLKTITAKHKDSMASKGKAVMAAQKAFFEAVQKPESSPETLRGLHRTLSDLSFERMLERRAMRQEMRALLTPDQREKLARMEGRMEGMRMARPGIAGEGGMMMNRQHREHREGVNPDLD